VLDSAAVTNTQAVILLIEVGIMAVAALVNIVRR
jgi:hypothetical protein